MSAPGTKLVKPDADLLARVDALLTSGPAAQEIQQATKDAMSDDEAESGQTIDAGTRAKLSLTPYESRKEDFLRRSGYSEFKRRPNGSIVAAKKPDGDWVSLDKPFTKTQAIAAAAGSLAMPLLGVAAPVVAALPFGEAGEMAGDIADLAGPGIEAGSGLLASLIGKGGVAAQQAKGVLGDAIGGAVRAGAERLALGSDVGPAEVGKRAAVNALTGIAPAAVGAVARGGYRSIPSVAREFELAQRLGEKRPVAEVEKWLAESAKLEQEVGGPLTAGQAAGAPSLRGTERAIATSTEPGVALAFQDLEASQRAAVQRHFKASLAKVGPEAGQQKAAEEAFGAGSKVLREGAEHRRKLGDIEFTAAHQMVGGQAVIALPRFQALVASILDRFSKPGMVGEQEALRELLSRKTSEFVNVFGENQWMASPQQMADMLSGHGKAGFGEESLIVALANPKTSKGVAKDLWSALMDDLADAAKQGGPAGGAAAQLQAARQHYADMSRYLEDNSSVMLKDMFGMAEKESLELLPQRMATNMPLEKLAKGLKVIEAGSKEAADQLRRSALESMVEAKRVELGGEWSIDKWKTLISDPRTQRRMAAILGESPKRRDFFNSLWREIEYVKRATFSGTTGGGQSSFAGSRTAPVAQALLGSGRIKKFAQAINLAMKPEVELALMTTPKGRETLLRVFREYRVNGRVGPETAAQMFAILRRDEAMSTFDVADKEQAP